MTPPLRPGLIVSDLDGTFLSPDGSVSLENAAAVRAAQDAGIPVLFATGRPVRWLEVIRDLCGAHPTVIASNGAVLYDLGADQPLDRICLDPDVTMDSIRSIRAAVPDAAFAFETGTRFGYEPSYTIDWGRLNNTDAPADPAMFTGPVEEIAYAETYVKLLVQSLSTAPDVLLERVDEALAGALTATHSQHRHFGLVEISAAGITKASMLRRWCAKLGVEASRVAAFGDMPNDVDMLSWAGMPYVVGNAHPSLLGGGYTVVPTNAESGVGRTIMELLDAS